ncbi:MAG: hypothetical protein KH100_15690 [Dysgonomonas mossii]|uniref:hypothetical protein n=1 Tax=Dysgonomonas mossii TaxID=163665 RepID=UPI001D4D5435|nr:hypothetical protein [Dysgonomonas mossii]MBS7112625.1 hypothetical protein [Dysgonomonas mossii]
MIVVKEFPNRQFASKEELFKSLSENKHLLKSQKKLQTKHSDSVAYSFAVNDKNEAVKSGEINVSEVNTLRVKIVVNSCNLFDSHSDVSINGSWNRTVKNNTRVLLLEAHKAQFDKIISDEIELKVESISWKDLGFDFEGKTDCLVFYATIRKDRNHFMFEQYAKGYVKEHSAGLRYVQIELAINSEAEWNKEEKEVWDKYYPQIANKEDVDQYGYFWAVIEQKLMEGSAVVFGSNFATPTISVEPVADTSTKKDPVTTTPLEEQKTITNLNLFI